MKLHFLPLIAALSVTCGVQAQQVDSQSGATAIAQGGNVVLPAQPAATVARQDVKQSGSLATTGQAFLGGAAVASGSFNCGATGGVSAGWVGGAFSAQGAKSLKSCVLLNIIAMAEKDPELAVAALCVMDEGKEVMAEAGRQCPSEKRAQQARPVSQQQPMPWQAGG